MKDSPHAKRSCSKERETNDSSVARDAVTNQEVSSSTSGAGVVDKLITNDPTAEGEIHVVAAGSAEHRELIDSGCSTKVVIGKNRYKHVPDELKEKFESHFSLPKKWKDDDECRAPVEETDEKKEPAPTETAEAVSGSSSDVLIHSPEEDFGDSEELDEKAAEGPAAIVEEGQQEEIPGTAVEQIQHLFGSTIFDKTMREELEPWCVPREEVTGAKPGTVTHTAIVLLAMSRAELSFSELESLLQEFFDSQAELTHSCSCYTFHAGPERCIFRQAIDILHCCQAGGPNMLFYEASLEMALEGGKAELLAMYDKMNPSMSGCGRTGQEAEYYGPEHERRYRAMIDFYKQRDGDKKYERYLKYSGGKAKNGGYDDGTYCTPASASSSPWSVKGKSSMDESGGTIVSEASSWGWTPPLWVEEKGKKGYHYNDPIFDTWGPKGEMGKYKGSKEVAYDSKGKPIVHMKGYSTPRPFWFR